ncbi:MAG: glycosyl hydrolase [Candidatus Eisenbacteria bacterium]
MAGAGDMLILGTRKGVIQLRWDGEDCSFVREGHRGVPVPYAFRDHRTGTIWASLDHGHWGTKLSRSRDEGVTWEEVSAPAYPEGSTLPDGSEAKSLYLWVLAPGGDNRPERLYAGTEPGGLFVSDDGGRSFTLVESLWNHPSRQKHWFGGGRDHPGLHSVVVDPRDSDRIQVGISVAGVFESTDGGGTWAPKNRGLRADYLPEKYPEVGHDPHLLVSCPSDPDRLWQQNHCGIFRSIDGGGNWEDVSEPEGPAKFGFAVAVDEEDGDTAWVVPAVSDEMRVAIQNALCVCRTEDGGKTWTALRKGLPQINAYDIVFRHALDKRGDRLAFGTTTGNLYLSGDGGDTWVPAGNHFPPIYSVRFA